MQGYLQSQTQTPLAQFLYAYPEGNKDTIFTQQKRRQAAVSLNFHGQNKMQRGANTFRKCKKLIDNEGVSTLKIAASGGPGGVIAREDAALVLAQAAARGVAETGSLKVSVASSGAGQPPEDWTLVFRALSSQLAS